MEAIKLLETSLLIKNFIIIIKMKIITTIQNIKIENANLTF